MSVLYEGCGTTGEDLKEGPQELYRVLKQDVYTWFHLDVEALLCEKDTKKKRYEWDLVPYQKRYVSWNNLFGWEGLAWALLEKHKSVFLNWLSVQCMEMQLFCHECACSWWLFWPWKTQSLSKIGQDQRWCWKTLCCDRRVDSYSRDPEKIHWRAWDKKETLSLGIAYLGYFHCLLHKAFLTSFGPTFSNWFSAIVGVLGAQYHLISCSLLVHSTEKIGTFRSKLFHLKFQLDFKVYREALLPLVPWKAVWNMQLSSLD